MVVFWSSVSDIFVASYHYYIYYYILLYSMSEHNATFQGQKVIVMDPLEADLFIMRQRKRSLNRKTEIMAEGRKKVGSREDRRKAAKLELLKICETVGITEGKTKALALFSLRTGHTMQRAEAYLEELVDAGLITDEGKFLSSDSIASKKQLEQLKNKDAGPASTEEV